LEDDMQVVGQGENGKQALELVHAFQPDICVIDIEMPVMTGLDVAEALQQGGFACRVVILTTFARPGYFQRAMAAGVYGYLLKDSPSEELADAIRRVHAGKRVISPELSFSVWEEQQPLT